MKLQRAALLMIVLVLSMPIVMAQQLNVVTYSGIDGANGYVEVEDEVTIEAEVSIPGEEIINESQVRMYIDENFAYFDDCTHQSNYKFKCLLFEPKFQAYDDLTFTVQLRDDDNRVVASQTKTLVIDQRAPIITDLTVEPLLGNGKITVNYVAEDFATGTDTSKCSGIKEVKITAGGTELATDFTESGKCSVDNQVIHVLSEAGTHQICVKAKDYVNKESAPQCVEVTVDNSPPIIESMRIVDPKGFELTHVKQGQERTAHVNIVVTDDGLVEDVTANFKELVP